MLEIKKEIKKLPFELKLVIFYFIISPYYLWSSGLPQVSEFILLFCSLVYLVKNSYKLKFYTFQKRVVQIFVTFIVYILITNSVRGIEFKPTFFYIYNFIVFVLFLQLFNSYDRQLLLSVSIGVMISLFIQILMLILNGGYTGTRMVLSFNNPNQLAYFALLSSILFILSNSLEVFSKFTEVLIIFFGLLLILGALSTSGFLALVSLVIVYLFKNYRQVLKIQSVVLTGLSIIIIFISASNSSVLEESMLYKGIQTRKMVTSKKVSNISEDRGYYRITEHPEYWIFGSGEGNYEENFGSKMEFHSTFGNIQTSYGIIGFLIFLMILYEVFKKKNIDKISLTIPLFIYGITHNGIRDSFLWIILALILNDNFIKKMNHQIKFNKNE